MHLNTVQLASLRASILAVAANTVHTFADGSTETVGNLRTQGATGALADFMNTASSPAFYVWRTSVSEEELRALAAFDFALVDNLTVGKARVWEWLFRQNTIDPSKPNVRAGIGACWTGSAPLTAVGTAVLTACKRIATRAERVFATGNGAEATPGLLVISGQVQDSDVVQAGPWGS